MISNMAGATGNPIVSNTISPPAKVTGLIATPGNGQVTLNWTAPANGGSPITTYAVRYKLSSSSSYTNFVHPASTLTNITIPGLTNGATYNFFVKAVNITNRNNGGTPSDTVSASPLALISSNNLIAGVGNAEIPIMQTHFPVDVDTFTTPLFYSEKHIQVKTLQQFLNNYGYPVDGTGAGSLGKETSYFGKATREALIKFQKDKGIMPAIGNFGPTTRAVVNEMLYSNL